MVVGGFRSFHVLVLTHVITVVILKIRRYYIIYAQNWIFSVFTFLVFKWGYVKTQAALIINCQALPYILKYPIPILYVGPNVDRNTILTIWFLAATPSWLPYEKNKYSNSYSHCGNWSNHCTNNNPCGTLKICWEEQHMIDMSPQTKCRQSSALPFHDAFPTHTMDTIYNRDISHECRT